jgi:hypothetical protein
VDGASVLLVKIAGAVLVALALQIIGELVAALVMAPATIGLEWLSKRWWAQHLYRKRSARWLVFLWVPAAAICWAALETLSSQSGWVGNVALSLILLVPVVTIAITGWWWRSPFRRPRGEA